MEGACPACKTPPTTGGAPDAAGDAGEKQPGGDKTTDGFLLVASVALSLSIHYEVQ